MECETAEQPGRQASPGHTILGFPLYVFMGLFLKKGRPTGASLQVARARSVTTTERHYANLVTADLQVVHERVSLLSK